MLRRSLVLIVLVAALIGACAPLKNLVSGGSAQNASQEADMNAAAAQAQKTLPAFIKALQSPTATQSGFSVKAVFPYGTGSDVEEMWVSQLSYGQGQFQGTLDSSPTYATNLHPGDKVTVDPKNISDWMIIDNNRLLGGYSIHALRNRLNEADRAKFDAQFGVTIPDQPAVP